jgi:hypothetical protein
MTIHQDLRKAVQDDARRAGERDRVLLEARRARAPRRPRAGPAAPARLLARLLALPGRRLGQWATQWSTARPQAPGDWRARPAPGHPCLGGGAAAAQASPATRTEQAAGEPAG